MVNFNNPDIFIWDATEQTSRLIDVTVPQDYNVVSTTANKITKHKDLQIEIQNSGTWKKLLLCWLWLVNLGLHVTSLCYSVNRYKPLQNRLLQKPLQTVTNSYKPVTPQTVTNSYKHLQTVTNHLLHKLLQTVTLSVWHYGIVVSTFAAQSRNDCWHFITMNVIL